MKFRIATLTSAILLLLAFSHPYLCFLSIFGLMPFLWRLCQKAVRSFACGYGFGIFYGLGQLFWLAQLTQKWTGSVWLSLIPWFLAVSLYAIGFGVFGWIAHRAWKNDALWLIPFAWAGVEVIRSYIPVFAFPWGLICTPLAKIAPLLAFAHWGTEYIVSAWCVLMSLIFLNWKGIPGNQKLGWAAAATSVLWLGIWGAFWNSPSSKIALTIGQPGVDLAFGDPNTADHEVGQSVVEFERQARKNRSVLTILPEGLVHSGATFPPILPFPVSADVPILFGGQRGETKVFQSAFAYDGQWQVADKTRLVIFGEFVPGRDVLPFLAAFKLPTGDLSPGSKVTSLKIGKLNVGPLICFEGLFPDLAYRQALNGAQLLAVMSMDDWFVGTQALDQLRDQTIWRAVETGLPVARAAETGYSLVVDGHGAVLAQAPVGGRQALNVKVPVSKNPTIPWWLPIFPGACLVITFRVVLPFRRGEA